MRVFLPYDFLLELENWHHSMWDPVYSVSSCFRANRCPEEWDVSDLAYLQETPGYFATLPETYVVRLAEVAEMVLATDEDPELDDSDDFERAQHAADVFLNP